MLHTTAALIGIACAIVAILVILRALTLKNLIQAAQRGVMAIIAFVALGLLIQMLLPGIFIRGFLQAAGSSLLLGASVVVLALALILIAKLFSAGGSSRGGK